MCIANHNLSLKIISQKKEEGEKRRAVSFKKLKASCPVYYPMVNLLKKKEKEN